MERNNLPSIKILIVDDEKLERESWERALRLEGYSVWTAPGAEQALEQCDGHSFDLVILDFLMPGTDGVELLQRIRKRLPLVRSIIVSGKLAEEVGESDVSTMLRETVEASRYLHKPVSNERLKACIEELLTSHPSEKSWQDIAKMAVNAKNAKIRSAKEASKNLRKLLKKKKTGR